MIYIYNCYGGTHSSAIASAYHLGQLPKDRIPSKDEILSTYLFNRLTYADMGRVIYHGRDEQGDLVYTVGRGMSKHLIPALRDLVDLFHKNGLHQEKVLFSTTSPTVPFAMTMGGFFSRGLKIDAVGIPLLVKGAQQAYPDIIRLVNHTRQIGRLMTEDVKVLSNNKFK